VKDDVLIVRCQPDSVKLEIVKSAIAAVTTEDDSVKA
jgi:preprotein translocase subunit YajC